MLEFLVCTILYGSAALENRRGRIGIEDSPIPFSGAVIINHVHKDSVAAKAGLKKGDKIIYVDDKDILGPAGTEVTLIINRKGKIFIVTIVRQDVSTVNKAYED